MLEDGISAAQSVIERYGDRLGAWAIFLSSAIVPDPSDVYLVVWVANEIGGIREEDFHDMGEWPGRCAKFAVEMGWLTEDGHATVKGQEAVMALLERETTETTKAGETWCPPR